ncbi:MAG: restriction endonuclease subunit S [Candidatus Omnitrophota bacterium]|nr:restriction endonuclease subunit S [Candidatus Omnitrophota bacterium]
MKNNWQTKKIGEVCEIINGGTPDTKIAKFWGGEHLWITPKDMGKLDDIYVDDTGRKITDAGLKNSSAKILPVNSIILSSRAPIGHLAINTKEIATNQGCKGIVPKKGLAALFLFYFLKNSVELLNSLGSGTTFKELSGSKLAEVRIPLPPLPEQQCIVAILDKAFGAITKAKENAEKNLQNARELFESYLQSVFANPGDGWEERKLGEIANIEYGFTDKAKDIGDYRYIRITDIDKNGNLEKENKVFINFSEETKKFLLKDGDLLMVRTGATYAKVLLYQNFEKSVFASYLIRISFKINIINKLYWYFSKSRIYWDQAHKLSSGSAQPQFNGGVLKELIFYFPKSLHDQKSIVSKLDALSTETKKLEAIYRQKLVDLDELKKSVLQKAFNGDI